MLVIYTRSNIFWILLNQTKFDCNYPFQNNLAPEGTPFCAESIGKVNIQEVRETMTIYLKFQWFGQKLQEYNIFIDDNNAKENSQIVEHMQQDLS